MVNWQPEKNKSATEPCERELLVSCLLSFTCRKGDLRIRMRTLYKVFPGVLMEITNNFAVVIGVGVCWNPITNPEQQLQAGVKPSSSSR